MGKSSEFGFDAKILIKYILKNRKFLLWVSAAAFVGSLIISLLITPKYLSSAIIYPANYSDNKPWYDLKDNKAWFGQLYEIDHFMQILTSDEVRDKVIQKFDLGKHYGILPQEKYYKSKVNGGYESNVSFSRTRYQSVLIRVLDTDPEWAANIANEVIAAADTIMNKIYKQKTEKEAQLFDAQYKAFMDFMTQMADSLNTLGQQKGIVDVEHQSQELERAFSLSSGAGNSSQTSSIEKRLKELGKYAGFIHKQKNIIEHQADYFSQFMGTYINVHALLKQEMPYSYKFTVDKGKVAEKKFSPKRSVIVIVSTIAAFMMALMLLIMQDYFKKLLKD